MKRRLVGPSSDLCTCRRLQSDVSHNVTADASLGHSAAQGGMASKTVCCQFLMSGDQWPGADIRCG